jgi:hypothetical protein
MLRQYSHCHLGLALYFELDAGLVQDHFGYACLRFPMLCINPEMLFCLDQIEADLIVRRARAEQESWLGEVDGIDLTRQFLRSKREEAKRLARITPVEPAMPSLR